MSAADLPTEALPRPLAVGLGVLGALVLTLALIGGWEYLTDDRRFVVRAVRFEGATPHVSPRMLERAVENVAVGNFLSLDLDRVRASVEALPWVRGASVRRAWPTDLAILVVEETPVALWGDGTILNAERAVVPVVVPLAERKALPVLDGPDGSGPEALESWYRLGAILDQAGLHLAALTITRERALMLRLDDGVMLVVGRDTAESRLLRFMAAYRATLKAQWPRVRRVDLRYTNGLAVEWRPPTSANPAPEAPAGAPGGGSATTQKG